MALTSIPWKNASAGWGKTTVNKSVSGGELVVDRKISPHGIGTHSNSIIEFDVPPGYTRFNTTACIDKAAASQNTGGTINCLIFTKSPYTPAPADSSRILVPLQQLGFSTACTVRNMWTGKTVGEFTGEFAPFIRRHGAGLYRISAKK